MSSLSLATSETQSTSYQSCVSTTKSCGPAGSGSGALSDINVTSIGETCGLRLICDVEYKVQHCNLCKSIAAKLRRAAKMEADIARWVEEGDRPATIGTTNMELSKVRGEMSALIEMHGQSRGLQPLPPIRDLLWPREAVGRSSIQNELSGQASKY